MKRTMNSILRFRLVLIFFTGLIGLPSQPVGATGATWYVSTTGNDSNICASPASPCRSIHIAVQKAAIGDQVKVAQGLYENNDNEYYLVRIFTSIRLSGGWNATFSVQNGYSTVDGQNLYAGVYVTSGITVIMNRFIIQNCYKDNLSTPGGIVNNGSLILSDSLIVNNSSNGSGGGILNSGTLIVRGSTFAYNHAAEWGGGISNYGTAHISNSVISHNTAQKGGGVDNHGYIYIFNSTLFQNEASWGGALYNPIGWGSPTYLSNVTITDNIATTDAGGIFSNGYVYPQNTILAHNASPTSSKDCTGEMVSQGYNLIGEVSGCTITGVTTGNMTGVDPQFLPIVEDRGYYPLSSTSPAVNTGNPGGCTDGESNLLSTDQRGATRNGRCDIGAYEYTVPGPAASLRISSGNIQSAYLNATFTQPMQVRALDGLGSPANAESISFTSPAGGPGGTFENNNLKTITVATNEAGFTPALFFKANNIPGAFVVTASNQSLSFEIDFQLTNLDSPTIRTIFLPLLSKPIQIIDEFPFSDHCGFSYYVYNGANVAKMTLCVTKVRIRNDGQMYFDMRWTVEFLDPRLTSVYKTSDANNTNMYITDNLGNRYDHVDTGGAAAELTYFYPSGPLSADGWFMFPAKQPGATVFTFHVDDEGYTIGDIALVH